MCKIEESWDFGFLLPTCECDPVPDNDRDAISEFYDDQEEAVKSACGGGGKPADTGMLHAIVMHVVRERDGRSKRLAAQLVDAIANGYIVEPIQVEPEDEDEPFRLQRCHWELPLIGLVNMLLAIRRDGENGPEDTGIIKLVRAEWKHILDVINGDVLSLLPAGSHADHMRNTIVKAIATLCGDENFRKSVFQDDRTMQLVLTCWTHMTPPNRADVNWLVHILFWDKCGGCPRHAPMDKNTTQGRVLHTIGIKTLIRRFEEWLTEPLNLNAMLLLEMRTLYDFVTGNPFYSDKFMAAGMCNHVVTAMRRQKEHGDPDKSLDIYHAGFHIIGFLAVDCRTKVFDVPVQLPAGIVDILATALLVDCDYPTQEREFHIGNSGRLLGEGYIQFLIDMEHAFVACSGRQCPRGGLVPFKDALRVQFERAYVWVSRALLRRVTEGKEPALFSLQHWAAVATAMQISERDLLARWVALGECCSPLCQHRGNEATRTKKCGRCRVARYCSLECQKMDWKEHKAVCRHLQKDGA